MNFNNILDLLSYVEKSKAERTNIETGKFKNLFISYSGYFENFESKVKTVYETAKNKNWLFFDSKIDLSDVQIEPFKENEFINFFNDSNKNEVLASNIDTIIESISQEFDYQTNIKKKNTKIRFAKFLTKYKEQILSGNIAYNEVCIYYGEVIKEDFYFFLLLYALGFDIIIISPGGEKYKCFLTETYETDDFKNVSLERILATKKETKKIVSAAKIIEQQVKNMLYDNESTIKENNNQYEIEPVLYDCAIADIYGMLNEQAKFREGFEIIDNKIQMPHICTEINGCYEDIYEYQRLLKHIDSSENIVYREKLNYKGFHMNLVSCFHLFKTIKGQRSIIFNYREDKEKLDFYDKTKEKIIDNLIDIINNCFIDLNNSDRDIGITESVLIDSQFIKLYEDFDGIKEVPKVCFKLNNSINIETVFIILLLSSLGFDVIVLNISGSSLLKKYIKEDYFTCINLETKKSSLHYDDILTLKKKKFFGLF